MSDKVEVPQEYLCPITYVIMTDPVFDCNGHTYERSAIEEWFGKSYMSPITHSRVTNKNLTPNILLRGQISDFKDANKDKRLDLPEEVSQTEAKAVYTPPSVEFNGYKTSDGLDVEITANNMGENHLHTMLLVDKSGSMGQKVLVNDGEGNTDYGLCLIDVVRHACLTLARVLLEDDNPNHYITIISFTDSAERELVCQRVTKDNIALIERVINGITPESTTNIWDAFRLAIESASEVNDSMPDAVIHKMVIFTDGVPNIHPFMSDGDNYSSEQYIECIRRQMLEMSINCEINTLGFGRSNNLDSELLGEIARNFSGNYGFISDTSMLSTTWLYIIANILNNSDFIKPELVVSGIKESEIPYGLVYKAEKNSYAITIPKLINNRTWCASFKGKGVNAGFRYSDPDLKKTYTTAVNLVTKKGSDNLFELEGLRYKFAETLDLIINHMLTDNKAEATRVLGDFTKLLKTSGEVPVVQGYLEDIESSGKAHDGGQVSMAISRDDWYSEWGYHYLMALKCGHLSKCRTNFKDKGLCYETPGIKRSIEKEEFIFMNLPPPKASRKTANTQTLSSSQTLYNYDAGCFTADCMVETSVGRRRIGEIKKGDQLVTPDGLSRVVCVTEIVMNPNSRMVRLENGYITEYHPIYYMGRWQFPKDVYASSMVDVGRVYNFVLSGGRMITVDGYLVPTFGHNGVGDVIGHEYFGSERVIGDLECIYGYLDGVIYLYQDYFRRDEVSGRVNGITASVEYEKQLVSML